MKSKEEFQERFANGEFDALLKDANSPKDVVEVARNLGYELTEEDILSSELSDDMLSSVAGGKGDDHYHNTTIIHNSNTETDNSVNHNGTGNQAVMK